MSYLDNHVYDNGLGTFDDQNVTLHILSQEPATFANVATYTLGNKTGVTVGAPANRSGGGRRVTVPAITGGSVTGTGTATHYAVVDPANSRLLAASALDTPQAVTSGNEFTLAAFDIGIPGPV